MSYDNTNKGAVWQYRSKNGNIYYSGKINVNGVEHKITIFKNKNKVEGDKKPFMNIVIGDNQYNQNAQTQNNTQPQNNMQPQNTQPKQYNDDFEYDIPF